MNIDQLLSSAKPSAGGAPGATAAPAAPKAPAGGGGSATGIDALLASAKPVQATGGAPTPAQGGAIAPVKQIPVQAGNGINLPTPSPFTPMSESTPAVSTAKPLTLGDVVNGAKAVPGIAWDILSAIPKALIDSELHPSETELSNEKQMTSHPTTTFGKITDFLPNAGVKIVNRFFQPMFQPFADDVAAAVVTPEISDQIAKGQIPASALEDIVPALQKSNVQVVGDTAMAVLGAYLPDVAPASISRAASMTGIQALKDGAIKGSVAGGLFGTAQVASSGTTDPKEIAKIYASNIIGGALLGGVTHATIPLTRDAFTKATKDIVTQYGLPENVYIDGAKIKDIFQTNTQLSDHENELVRSLGLTSTQYKQAFTEGLSIEIPSQNITTITDKPYWGAIKDAFGFKPTSETIVAEPTPQVSSRIMNPARLLPSPDEIRSQVAAGKSPAQITYELSGKMLTSEAKKVVEEALQGQSKTAPSPIESPKAEAQPSPIPAKPEPLAPSVSKSVLDETPGTLQDRFSNAAAHGEAITAPLQAQLQKIEGQIAEAKPQSQEKKDLKIQLADVQGKIKEAQTGQTERAVSNAKSFRDTLTSHINGELKSSLPAKHVEAVVSRVAEHVSNPELVGAHANTPLREIVKNAHEEQMAHALKEATGIPQHLQRVAAEAQKHPNAAAFSKAITLADKKAIEISHFRTPSEFFKAATKSRATLEREMKSGKKKELVHNSSIPEDKPQAFKGKGYRVDTGFTHEKGATAADVVRYEQDELGNDLGVSKDAVKELENYPASKTMWVTKTAKDAGRYGKGAAQMNVDGWTIVAKDGDGGYLLVDKTKENASAVPEEKVPREPKPKAEKKEEPKAEETALKPEEMYNAEKDIAKGNPSGVVRAFKEVATLFNPVGQADPKAVDIIMSRKGGYEQDLFRTEQTFKAIGKMWDKQPEAARLDFMDKVETDRINELPEAFRPIAEMYRLRLDNAHKAIAEFKEIKFLQNFFPHFWKDEKAVAEANFYAKQNARRPLQGNKSFTKERVFATIQEGIKAGYKPVSTNPEELMQIYEQNVGKFLMANRIMADLKARGFARFVKVGGDVPDNFAKIDDAISRVYLNPNIPVVEVYDEQVFNKLNDFANSLGIAHERKYALGRGKSGVAGFTQKGTNKITTKFGTPLSVIAHELGHQLDYKYELQKDFVNNPATQKELRALADLRYAGHEVTDSYKGYIRSAPEKMAVMLEAYVHAPEAFQKVAPNTYKKFTDFINSHDELKPILDIKPSLVLGMREDSIHAGGAIMSGEYWVQKDVARLINNHLSKDHLRDTAIGQGIMNAKNTLNAFELGLSAFHLTMETLDTVITKFSIGLTKVVHGDFKGFGDMLTAPIAPFNYFNDGRKFYNGDPVMLGVEKSLFTGGASLRTKQYYKNTVFDDFMQRSREMYGEIKRGEVGSAAAKVPGQLLRVPLSAIEATMRPLFSYYIPRLKVGAFRDLYAAELQRNSAKIQAGQVTQETIARNTWNNIENRMGELNYDNLFWNRNLKASLMMTVRAVGWNLGTLREIGGGVFQDVPESVKGAFKGEGFDFTPKMAYTLSLFFTVATVSAIYQYLHTGQLPQSLKDLFYPRNGATDKSGEPYRVEFPTYLKDIYQSGIPQLATGDVFGAFDSATQMVKNKAAPEWSLIFDVIDNKDFYGDLIRNPHDNAPTQLKQLGIFLATQLTPFTFQQQQNLAKGHSNLEQQAEAFLGIIKAPKDVIQSDYQKIISSLYSDQVGGFAPRTPEQVAKDDAKAAVVEQIKKGDYSGIQDLLAQGIIKPSGVGQFIQNARLTTPQKQYKGLTPENKNKVQQLLNP